MLPFFGARQIRNKTLDRVRPGAGHGTRKLSRIRRCVLIACVLSNAIAAFAAASDHLPRWATWSFREDFSHGIPGWMSYPLAQDVGYDPSLYTARVGAQAVLERDVVAVGERRLHVGLLRALSFHASSASRIEFHCELFAGGAVSNFSLMLDATNGKRYTVQVPVCPHEHSVTVSGAQLGLGAIGAEIEVLVLEAIVHQPALGSHNRLILSGFAIDAEHAAELEMEAPRLLSSATGDCIASEAVMAASPLTLRTNANSGASTAAVFTPDGVQAFTVPLPAGTATTVNFGGDAPQPGLWRIEVTGAKGRTAFHVLVLGETPAHPRVLFDAKRMDELRSNPALQPVRERIHQQAKKLAKSIAFNPRAGENIARLSPDSVFPGLVPYFTLMDNYANAIGYNALDYRLNGNVKGLDVARRALLSISAWPTWTPPWFASHGLHTYYEAGIFTQRTAFGYDLIADELSASDRARIAAAFWQNAISPAVQEYFVNDRLPIAASNHMAHTVGGALAAALAVAGDAPDWQEKYAPAVAELLLAYDHLLRDAFPGDGSEAEPAGYENFALRGMSWGAAALNSFHIRPQRLGDMLEAFWWLKYIEVRPDLALDTGDFDGTQRTLSGLAWPSASSRDPALQELYERSSHSLEHLSKTSNTDQTIENEPAFLDLACCAQPPPAAKLPPPSRMFPGRGSAVLRSGWGADDTVISLRAGPWFNHEHHDQGSFQAAAFGEKLIGEAGYSNYYTDPRYADYFTQAPGHNTIVLDDDPFSQQASDGRKWASLRRHPHISGHVFSAGIDYVAADLADAYDGSLRTFTREYLFIKPDVLIVRDQVTAPEAHRFAWLLHVPAAASARTEHGHARIQGKQAVALVTAAAGNWTQQPTPIPITAYGDLDRQEVEQPSLLRLSTAATRTAGFLVGIRFARHSEAAPFLTSVHSRNADGFAFNNSAGQTEILFRTSAGPLQAGSFSTDGNAIALTARDGTQTVFAASARSLREGATELVSALAPVDMAATKGDGWQEIAITNQRATRITLPLTSTPHSVQLDGKSMPFPTGAVTLTLAAGEHVIRIRG